MGVMNSKRANWAEAALDAFMKETGQVSFPADKERDETEEAIGDLICDLLHFARFYGVNSPTALHSKAFEMFSDELNDNE